MAFRVIFPRKFSVLSFFQRGLSGSMKALEFSHKEKTLLLTNKEIPKVQYPHDVLVKVAYSGVCGTDLHIIDGNFPCKRDHPIVLGHEFVGDVVQVGEKVRALQIGDRVAVDPNSGCLKCTRCRMGFPHLCRHGVLLYTLGIYVDGGWAEYCLVPDLQTYKFPSHIDYKYAALAEPISCMVHAVDRLNGVRVGRKILIVGAGIVGILWAAFFHRQGHKTVVVSEPNPVRTQLVNNLGYGFECVAPSVLKERHAANPRYGFDVVLDCSGVPQAVEQAFTLLKSGGRLGIFGCANMHDRISLSPFEIYQKELTIVGMKVNPHSFPPALALVESFGEAYLNYDKLGIKSYALSEYVTALQDLKKGAIAKAMFKLS